MRQFQIAEQSAALTGPTGEAGGSIRFFGDSDDASIMHLVIASPDADSEMQLNFAKGGLLIGIEHRDPEEEQELVEERLEAAEASDTRPKDAKGNTIALTDAEATAVEFKARADYRKGVRSTASIERKAELDKKSQARKKPAQAGAALG